MILRFLMKLFMGDLIPFQNRGFFLLDAPKPPTEETYIRSDEYGTSARFKRSSAKIQKNGSLNVETLVVADKKMLEKHGKENVTTYILTVMNMVRRAIIAECFAVECCYIRIRSFTRQSVVPKRAGVPYASHSSSLI